FIFIDTNKPMFHWIGQNLHVNDFIYGCIWVFKNDEHHATQLITVTVNHMVGILYFINYEHEAIENPNERIITIESAFMKGENRTILIDIDIMHPTVVVMDFYRIDEKNIL
ncbi:unnamed protein product, partial [Rotaria sp. Silwood2]